VSGFLTAHQHTQVLSIHLTAPVRWIDSCIICFWQHGSKQYGASFARVTLLNAVGTHTYRFNGHFPETFSM